MIDIKNICDAKTQFPVAINLFFCFLFLFLKSSFVDWYSRIFLEDQCSCCLRGCYGDIPIIRCKFVDGAIGTETDGVIFKNTEVATIRTDEGEIVKLPFV